MKRTTVIVKTTAVPCTCQRVVKNDVAASWVASAPRVEPRGSNAGRRANPITHSEPNVSATATRASRQARRLKRPQRRLVSSL